MGSGYLATTDHSKGPGTIVTESSLAYYPYVTLGYSVGMGSCNHRGHDLSNHPVFHVGHSVLGRVG